MQLCLRNSMEGVLKCSYGCFFSFSGDFFKDSLPEAELYILARILHDWTDEHCVELLQRIYKACKPGLSISECERDERLFFFFFSRLLEMREQIVSHNAADPREICPSDFDQSQTQSSRLYHRTERAAKEK